MSSLQTPVNVPVWVDYDRCKACDICVDVCPSGTLAMRFDKSSINGKIIDIINPNSCIGCNNCELSCPDFAIHVADRKEFKFAKLTKEAKEMAAKIKENKYMVL
ncbi:2-oxoglutarate:acceptor oxidoreductase [Helicobacter sp. 16-1353]|uniref:4Fe-4S binding protein n=1 Tax=Helicobacter sp. 16-1353 TaxID=2004996 RepID=UPI000DCF4017|nr:4Fe-4S binding protein [Helicobacter sp. 16-1353]RAX54092.1 2-oxoglutarate:acceptor oxidoreductase [Helicobacter sp. 16-1353]